MEKINFYELTGWPPAFGMVLLSFSFILFLAPYLAEKDFGVFKIPSFSPAAKWWLRFVGPVIFLVVGLSFPKFFTRQKTDAASASTPPVATETSRPSPLASPLPSATVATDVAPSPRPTERPTEYPHPSPQPRQVLIVNGFTIHSAPKNQGDWYICLLGVAGTSRDQFSDGPLSVWPLKSGKRLALNATNGETFQLRMRMDMDKTRVCGDYVHAKDEEKFTADNTGSKTITRGELRWSVNWHIERK